MWAFRRQRKNDGLPSFFRLSSKLERAMGIEPTRSAWKAEVLPLNYARTSLIIIHTIKLNIRYSFYSTSFPYHFFSNYHFLMWRGKDSNLRRLSRQIYSLI